MNYQITFTILKYMKTSPMTPMLSPSKKSRKNTN